MAKKKVGGFTISTVADRYEVHPQTLRSYEREGLLCPARTKGNTRLYTEEDLEQLELILTLTRELGINLAGVEVVLHMRRKMQRMHDEVDQLVEYLQTQCDLDPEFFQGKMKGALVPVPPLNLMRVGRTRSPLFSHQVVTKRRKGWPDKARDRGPRKRTVRYVEETD